MTGTRIFFIRGVTPRSIDDGKFYLPTIGKKIHVRPPLKCISRFRFELKFCFKKTRDIRQT